MAQSSISRFSKLATDPLRSFRFLVEFSPANGETAFTSKIGSFSGGFTNVSGLAINTQSIGYREGGFNTTLHQVPGMTTFSPISLQRGTLFGAEEGILWMKALFTAAAGEGIAGADGKSFRFNLTITVLDHPLTNSLGANDSIPASAHKMQFKVYNAWITSLSYSDLNAGDNQLLFETMQLVHEGLSVKFVS